MSEEDESRESLLPRRSVRLRRRPSLRLSLALLVFFATATTLLTLRIVIGEAVTSTLFWRSRLFTPDHSPGYDGPSPVTCPRRYDPLDAALLALEAKVSKEGSRMTIWSSAKHPESIKAKVRTSWTDLNPDWTFSILDDAQAREFIVDTFGDDHALSSIVKTYDSFPRVVSKLDLLRYALLWRHGGVWTDSDTIAMQPISNWIGQDSTAHTALAAERDWPFRLDPDYEAKGWVTIDRGYQLVQWTMLARRPFSPVMRRALVKLMQRASEHHGSIYSDSDVLYVTGPHVLTDAALEAAACALEPTPFGWLNITNRSPQTVEFGDIAFMPRQSFDADPHRNLGSLQKVEHLFDGKASGTY